MSASRLFIHGSCVSRDTVPFLGSDVELVWYSARQSMISAMSPPVALPAAPPPGSPFQSRLVRDDFASSVPGLLRTKTAQGDLLLVDLVDERLGVIAVPGGGYVTRSQELLDSGLCDLLPGGTVVPFASEEHFSLWQPAAEQYVELLREVGLFEHTLLVVATFAETTDTGSMATRWRGEPAAIWNERFDRYHEVLAAAGLRTHRIGERAIASSTHRWGSSAYHYVDDAYLAIAAAVRAMVS